MLCENCKKNEAKIHLIKLTNGIKTEIWLCEECAKNMSDGSVPNAVTELGGASFQNILNGFFEVLNKNKREKIQIVCKNCGLTYSQFKRSGQLGCSECYESFSEFLVPMLKRTQGEIEHIGKIPTRQGNLFIEKKRIKKLKEELQRCIVAEEYEEAAILRDKIKVLEKGKGGHSNNEELDK